MSNAPSRFIKEIDKQYILNPLTDWEEELSTKFDDPLPDRFQSLGRGGYARPGGAGQRGGAPAYPGQGGAGRPSAGMAPKPQVGTAPRPAPRPAPRADFVPDSPSKVEVGQTIEHDRFGIGVVVSLEGDIASRKAVVDFKEGGRKTLLLKFAKIRVVAR